MDIDTSIFKAYDIRGVYPTQINGDIAYKIGKAFVKVVKPEKEVLIGHDVRLHSVELKERIIQALLDSGVNVIDVGLMSTDMLYFGVGTYKTDGGIQVTASHNPPEWHGMKMVRQNVVPMTLENGIGEIRDYILKDRKVNSSKKGRLKIINSIVDDYCKYILTWIDSSKIKPIKVVINPNFGYAGIVFKRLIEIGHLPIDLVSLNSEPDGNFPKGRPDPFIPENRVEFLKLVKDSKADLGITWDADADRVFFCADDGKFIDPYFLNTVLIKSMLQKNPKQNIIYDPRYTWALIETIKENGGTPIICRVGHSYIKGKMREVNALFAAESSGHTYYRDYWFSDCGMIPAVQILEYLSKTGSKLSEVLAPVKSRYFISGEINFVANNSREIMQAIENKYNDATLDRTDGISIEYSDFRFNIRTSNTEPLLRLNLEAKSQKLMENKRDEVIGIMNKLKK